MPLPDWSSNPIRQIKGMVDDSKLVGKRSFFWCLCHFITVAVLSEKDLIEIKLWQSAAQTFDVSGLGHMDGAEREALASFKLLKVKTHKSQVMWGWWWGGLLNKATTISPVQWAWTSNVAFSQAHHLHYIKKKMSVFCLIRSASQMLNLLPPAGSELIWLFRSQ